MKTQPKSLVGKAKIKARIVPVKVIVDVDPETGQEYGYEYRPMLELWRNIVTDKYVDTDFMERNIYFYVLRVEFGDVEKMDGGKWASEGRPKFLTYPAQ